MVRGGELCRVRKTHHNTRRAEITGAPSRPVHVAVRCFLQRHAFDGHRRRGAERARVAEEGLELPIVFRGKTYVLAKAGDQRGIIVPKRVP